MDTPEIQTPSLPELKVPPVAIERPAIPNLEVNDPTLQTPPIPDLEVPPVAIERPAIPNLEVNDPNVSLNPGEDTNRTSETPELPTIDLPPPQSISVPALHQTTNNNTENASENVEVTNNLNIYQQPGEDAEELTARIMLELERQGRARYYD